MQIIEAAVAEFASKGYFASDVAAIAKKAGVAKGTIYNYFSSKEDLFMGVVRTGLGLLEERMRAIRSSRLSPVGKIERALKEYLGFVERNWTLYQVITKEAIHLFARVSEEYCTKVKSHVGVIETLINDGINSKAFRKVDARTSALVLLGMADAVTWEAVLSNRKPNVLKQHKAILEIYLRGIVKQ
jgi:TetR/AcrR family fatty acid metabolism transcriptional regulator